MTKYLVIANIYQYGYGIDNTLFGIFNTKEEAVRWIINNPTQEMGEEKPFNFFEWYEKEKVVATYEYVGKTSKSNLRPRKTKTGERTMSKEEYAEKYIKEFGGSPLCVGYYIE